MSDITGQDVMKVCGYYSRLKIFLNIKTKEFPFGKILGIHINIRMYKYLGYQKYRRHKYTRHKYSECQKYTGLKSCLPQLTSEWYTHERDA